MSERVLIVGQGLAGTALALELEAAGRPFLIVSDGHARAASMAAAGLVNPVAGQRFVPVWRVAELLPFAEQWYRAVEARLGLSLWHPLRLRRLFSNEVEAARAARKQARGEFAPWATAREDGVGIHGAAWVDLPALLTAAAHRWRERGVLIEGRVTREELQADATGATWRGERFDASILCTGAGELARQWFTGVPFEVAKGEIVHVAGARLGADEAVSRGVWVLPDGGAGARVGATYERGVEDFAPTAAAREHLLSAARTLVAGELTVIAQRVGLRTSVPDRVPLLGWSEARRLGVFGALGSKGTLCAPWLARAWAETLSGATKCWPREVSSERFARNV